MFGSGYLTTKHLIVSSIQPKKTTTTTEFRMLGKNKNQVSAQVRLQKLTPHMDLRVFLMAKLPLKIVQKQPKDVLHTHMKRCLFESLQIMVRSTHQKDVEDNK
ncbi:hypothetical protein BDA96_07G130600 [Sorghum bicolor]|uniref:Uncharacterized protein n=2 Tax=Sorghum bicolor TaxID=4558 RepID=A0A921QJR5_SORBI|nr:hypothetical protein BDA96_07G130600 [Sorghum bicolor]OQU80398.1 hypothetical protein SORBI_3007G121650 [Sorghum bicolor]